MFDILFYKEARYDNIKQPDREDKGMKVKLEENYRKLYTLEDLDAAKIVIACESGDEETAKGWAEYAAREALSGCNDYMVRVIEASARTARNRRAWNAYGEGSKDMDVWIVALVETTKGYVKLGAYLTDIFDSGQKKYQDEMYIQRYGKI